MQKKDINIEIGEYLLNCRATTIITNDNYQALTDKKKTRHEIEKEWQLELKQFLDYHSDTMKNMTEEESNKYVRDNKINEKLQQLQKDFQKNINTKELQFTTYQEK